MYKFILTKPSSGSSGKMTSLVIPLAGQASRQGVSNTLGHSALRGWACWQSSETREEKPFLQQLGQRGSSKDFPEAATQEIQQKLLTNTNSKRCPAGHTGISTEGLFWARLHGGSWPLRADSRVRMLECEFCLHHFLALRSW